MRGSSGPSDARPHPFGIAVREGWTNETGGEAWLEPDGGNAPTSSEVAAYLQAEHRGPARELAGVGSLENAGERDLAFCVYDSTDRVAQTDAGVVICLPDVGEVAGQTQILTPDPRLAFARAAGAFFGDEPTGETQIHPSAVVDEDAELADGVRIGANVYVGEGVHIGEGCTIRAGSVIGGAGFGFARDDAGTPHRIPHHGAVRLGAGVEVGPNCTIDRAVFDETVIGADTKLSARVHLAHQVTIGRATTVAVGSSFCGGASIGERVTVHPHVAVAEGVEVGDGAELGMNSTVLADVPPGTTVVGSPARPIDRSDAEHEPDGPS